MNPADHEWAKEQIAAHLAGGLSAEERTRIEAHTASCAECIAEIDAARRFDRQMDDLFTPVRAKAGLEEKIIQKLRTEPLAKPRPMGARIFMAAAAVFVLGLLGYILVEVDQRGAEGTFAFAGRSAPAEPPMNAAPEKSYDGYTAGVPRAAGPLTGAHYRGKDLVSADELVRLREGKESDHSESLDDLSATRSLKRLEAGPGMAGENRRGANLGAMMPPAPPAATPAPVMAFGNAVEADRKSVYSLRDDSPSQQKAQEQQFFKPGDARAAAAPKPELAKADANKDGRANEFKQRQVQTGLQEKAGQDKGGGGGQAQAETPVQQPTPRKVIRTGEVEYEIESFDNTVGTISKLVEEESGFIATVNSDKLPNGKVRGTVVVRCPPERLDTLLLKLRGLGELKSQNIRSQDVGKQYYDLESRLKAARTMEGRLLEIIKSGKGEIKDLLLAEKELGEWRTKIEIYEGEKRYYDNQIGMSTLTVTLSEKEIRSASAVTQTERVNMSLQVDDVEKAHKDALAAVAESKGRVTKSDLKQHAAGQYTATLHFEVAPDAALALRDRLKQLGTVATLDIDRVQETEGAGGKVQEGLKVRVKDTQFFVSIYNLANVSPRETVIASIACVDTEASYKAILARIEKAGGRVISSSLNRQKNDQTTGTLRFEIKTVEADAVLQDVRAAGEIMRLDVSENPDTQNVTKSKRGFQVQLFGMGLVEPRETTTLTIAAKDVPAAYRALQEALAGAEARLFTSQLNENDRQNVSATLGFDFRRDNDAKITNALMAAGDVLTRSSTRAQDVERVVDSKKRINLTLVNLASIPVRDVYTLAVEVDSVDGAVTALEALAAESKGRIIDSRHTRGAGGRNVSRITIDLPLAAARGAADKVKGLGQLRVFDTTRNAQAPEGDLAVGRLDVTLSNPSQLVDSESGPWARIKGGLSVGLTALSWSLTLVVVGLCFVVPVGLIGWLGLRIYRRTKAA